MPPQNPHHARRWAILAVLGIAQLMVVLDATIVNIALPRAQRALGFSNDSRQWIVTAYALAFGSLLLLGGRIGDLFGRKRTFIAGLLGFAVASAIGGAAGSFGVLVAARAAAGRLRRAARAGRARPADHHLHRPVPSAPRRSASSARSPAAAPPIGLLLGGVLTEYALLALVPVREPAVRDPGRGRRVLAAAQRRPGAPPAARRPRHDHRHDRPVRARLRLLARRDHQLGRPADGRDARRVRRAARRVRR